MSEPTLEENLARGFTAVTRSMGALQDVLKALAEYQERPSKQRAIELGIYKGSEADTRDAVVGLEQWAKSMLEEEKQALNCIVTMMQERRAVLVAGQEQADLIAMQKEENVHG